MKNRKIIILCVTAIFIVIGGIFAYQTLKDSEALRKDTGVFEATYDSANPIGEISFWHYNKNEAIEIVRSFKKNYPNINVNLKVFPLKDMVYQKKLFAAFKSGSGVPDIIASDASFVKRFTNNDEIYMDLSDKVVEEISANMMPYTIDMGTNIRGELKALTNKLPIVAFLYKKSVAKKYLGVSEPFEIESIMLSKESILKAASTIKEKSNGKVALFSSWTDIEKMYVGTRQQGWFFDNKFWMDQKVEEFIDFAKEIKSNKYEAGFSEDTKGYDKAITDDESFMITVCSPSAISWVVGKNAIESGKWGIAKPLEPFGWGGTWYGIYSKSNAKDLSWKFLKHLTTDDLAMKEWAVNHDELPNNLDLLKQGIPYSKTFEANLPDFYDYSVESNYRAITQYDDIINKMFREKVKAYLDGDISSKEELFKGFKKEFKDEFPEIEVK